MAVPYYGDFAEDATVYIPFNTFSSDDPSASVTVTDLADADIMVHKNGSTTQIATDGATVAINFDTITGNHLITIDTSIHADYAVGGEYSVRIEGATVDAAAINAWVGAFSIERAGGALALLKSGTYGLSAIKTETAAILADTGTDGVVVVAASKTGYTLAATTGLGNQTANLTGNISGSVGSVTGAVGSVTGAVGSVTGAVGSVAGHTPQTGDSFARLGAPAGASVSADVAAVKVDTAAVLLDTGTDGVVVAAASKTGYALADSTSDAVIADAVWNAAIASYGSAGTYGESLEAVGASADPWLTPLPGAYGAGTAGKIIGDNINAPIGTVDTVVDGIVTTLGAAGAGLTALGDARVANLDAAISTRLAPAGTLARVTLTDTCSVNSDMRGTNSAALASVCTEGRLAELDAANLPTEIDKVPKSDSTVSWNATALAAINAEVDTALNTAIPAAPTAGSMNAYIQQVKFVIKNKMEITEADGATVVYKDDGTTPYCTVAAAFSTNSTTTTRKALA